jgi:hypothetical protein
MLCISQKSCQVSRYKVITIMLDIFIEVIIGRIASKDIVGGLQAFPIMAYYRVSLPNYIEEGLKADLAHI